MSTSVQGRVVRPIGPDTFADLTGTPLAEIARDGLLFDGPLEDAEVFAIWARMTSTDDTDQERRDTVRAAVPCCHACAVAVAYLLGDDLPAP